MAALMIHRASRRLVLLSQHKTSACPSFDQSSRLPDMVRLFGGQKVKVRLGQAA